MTKKKKEISRRARNAVECAKVRFQRDIDVSPTRRKIQYSDVRRHENPARRAVHSIQTSRVVVVVVDTA